VEGVKRATQIAILCVAMFFFGISDRPLQGCSRAFATYNVLGTFSVSIKDPAGKPVNGVEVTITRFITEPDGRFIKVVSQKVSSELTNKDGAAGFRLEPGEYFISTNHAHVEGGAGTLQVSGDNLSRENLELQWPNVPIIKLQHVSGDLAIGKEHLAFANADIAVTEAYSAEPVGKTSTNEQGRFRFPDVKPGLYVLHIEERRECDPYMCKIQGNIVVEVSPSAKEPELPRFGLTPSSCGLAAYNDDGSMTLFE
jgi:hypothetical protein